MDKAMNNLEKVAKVAGYEWQEEKDCWYQVVMPNSEVRDAWNPYESDADAFRLMVDANISIEWVAPDYANVNHYEKGCYVCGTTIDTTKGGDKPAATRKAVLDCAAAIYDAKQGGDE